MKKIIISVIFLCSIISGNIGVQAADLDLTITPIRNNLSLTLNHSTTGSVTLYNNSTESHSFIMGVEDCTTSTNNGTPLCHPINSGTLSVNSLASWITFDTTGVFSVTPKGKRVITYTINTPVNAIPGGHYGAIFFNVPTAQQNANISMNRRIGSLLLVTVPGNIVVSPEFGNFLITGAGGVAGNQGDSIGDLFSPSQTGKVIEQVTEKSKNLLMMFADPIVQKDIIDFINPIGWDIPDLEPNTSFNTDFTLPVNNKGTIHIIPQGRITLHEEDGTQLKNIGKELILNDFGVFIREDVVDYLTINEGKSSVLPNTNRTFTMNWQGFAHETRLPDKTTIITYESPGDYYSRLAREEQGYIKPWEKLAITHFKKTITAKIDLNYIHPITKENIVKNYEIPLTIEYDAIVKKWNTGLILIFVYIGLIIWFMKRRKKSTKETGNNRTIPYMNDEIEALEIARNTIANKTKKTTPVKKVATKKTTSTETIPGKKAPSTSRKTPIKKPVTDTEV